MLPGDFTVSEGHGHPLVLINHSMECWYSAFNAQGSRLIIVVVQLGAVRIYAAAVEALRKKERQDETQFATKIDGFLSFMPRWMLMYFFAGLFWISPCVWTNSILQKLQKGLSVSG
jgi:hypothetical protein